MTLRAYVFPKLRTTKDVVKDMSKNPGLRTTSPVNMLKDPKYLCNLPDGTFIIFFQHSGEN